MKLSFIVPIYNVKPYLRKCVDSLLHQDYEDYEIILVDDGSTDGSGELADDIVRSTNQQPSIIKVLHQANRGLSGARNAGIELACGEYICFVDSDDYWEPNVLGKMMTQIERDNLDVLRFRWQNVRDNGEVFNPYQEANFVDLSNEPLSGLDYLNQRMGIQCYAWSFIVKRTLCEQERFTEGILFEDTDWMPRMLVKAQCVAGTETMAYNYLWRESGITLSKGIAKLYKELDDKIALASRLKMWGDSAWYRGMISALVVSIINVLSHELYNDREKYIGQLRNANLFPLKVDRLNSKTRRKVRLINLSPALAVWMLHIKNR